jgi:hypothetical protein
METKPVMIVVEGRIELMRSVAPAPVDYHHNLLLGFPEGGHHLVEILAQLLRIKVRNDFIEDLGGAVLDRANHRKQHPTRDPAPGAIAHPRWAFETLIAFDLAWAEGTRRQPRALGFAPPARPRQGKTPEDGFIFIEQNDLPLAGLVLQGGEFERGIREVRGVGSEPPSGTTVA